MSANVGLGVTSIASFFADFLKPVAPFALYLLFFILVLLAISLVIRTIPPLNLKAEKTMPTIWYSPLFCTMLISLTIMAATYQLGNQSGGSGYLAENFQLIDDMQSELGLINKNIEKLNSSAEDIITNTDRTANNTGSIDKKMDELIMSSDPRKELANNGIAWSVDSLASAITAGDFQTIDLFYKGGFLPIQASNAIEELLIKGFEPIKTLEYLFQNEKFGVNPNNYNLMYDAILEGNDAAVKLLINAGSDLGVRRTDTFYGRGYDRYTLDKATPACFANFVHELDKTHFKVDVPKSQRVLEVLQTKQPITLGRISLLFGMCTFEYHCPIGKAPHKAPNSLWGCINRK